MERIAAMSEMYLIVKIVILGSTDGSLADSHSLMLMSNQRALRVSGNGQLFHILAKLPTDNTS